MNISWNWLGEYLQADTTVEETVEVLTSIGLEVEGIERIEAIRGGLAGVVVGEVVTCEPHPDSDHLHVTTVNIGASELLGIVCGASNVCSGQRVAVATIGATLYPAGTEEGFKIKRSKIRGIESLGMLCAEDELGLGNDHAGIMVLAEDAPVGLPLKKYLECDGRYRVSDDYRISIGLTPNRIDAASHYGVARDLAAWYRTRGRSAAAALPEVDNSPFDTADTPFDVTVEDRQGAPRYAGVVIDGITVGPSPIWLQDRLRAIGLNPHNNVVDVTNYVLHELCQPLHAFDSAKIEGNRIVVRTCPAGTVFRTLDGVKRTLEGTEVMICDAVKPMCIAGVMGGADSGVSDSTTSIFLESAYFDPVRIRKAARRNGINSDASFRFERGIDPSITIFALKRAANMICSISGGHIASEIVDIYPDTILPVRFDISLGRINSLIGKQLTSSEVKSILEALEIEILSDGGDILTLSVPRYRVDVEREADIVEDILRIYGYNNIEIPATVRSSLTSGEKLDKERITNRLADFLASQGFTEIMSNSLTKGAYYDGLTSYPPERCARLLNPLSTDLNVMRQSLLFNALEAVALNTNHRRGDLRLFEFGNTYFRHTTGENNRNIENYTEKYRLGITLAGNWVVKSWNEPEERSGFFHLKATIERILRLIGVNIYDLHSSASDSDLFSEAIELKSGERTVAILGVVAPNIRALTDVKGDVWFAEVEISTLLRLARKVKVRATELARFPEVRRDLALLVDRSTTFEHLRELALSAERKLLKKVELFDVYEGSKLPDGKKSYALSFTLQDTTQTLTESRIEQTMATLIRCFNEHGAEIRNG